jgi:hypothetical protein
MARVIALLKSIPLTPWWWIGRRRERERRLWVRHLSQYY